MYLPIDDLIEVLLPLSGSLEARVVQVGARSALRHALRGMSAGARPLPRSFNPLAVELRRRVSAVQLTPLERAQVEMVFAPHRLEALAMAWKGLRLRTARAPSSSDESGRETVDV